MVTTIEVLGLILGSNVFIEVLKYAFNKKALKANADKIDTESRNLALESEIRTSEFYKKEWQELIKRYEGVEKQLEDKIKEYIGCRAEIALLQKQYEELLRQITFLKTQIKDG